MPKYEVALSEAYFPAQEVREVREITVGGLLRETAARRPAAEALVEVRQSGEIGRRWSYAALLAESERLALALASRFRPGERVVVWSPNSPEWVLMEYACALAGLVLVTANPVSTPVEDSAKGRRKRLPARLVVCPWRETGSRRRGARVFWRERAAEPCRAQAVRARRPPAGRHGLSGWGRSRHPGLRGALPAGAGRRRAAVQLSALFLRARLWLRR